MRRMLRWLRNGLAIAALALAVLATVVVVRTLRYTSNEGVTPATLAIKVDESAAADRLACAIAIETVSTPDARTELPDDDPQVAKFRRLHGFLKTSFPLARDTLAWEVISGGSLLLTWKGSDASLKPLLLLAHLDTVPAPTDEMADSGGSKDTKASKWTHPPFARTVDGEFIWGRGALDDKVSALGILEAAEALLGAGFHPTRTVLFAFGQDEEVTGRHGAIRIAATLRERGVTPECVLDEGSFVVEGVVPGLSVPVAPVGVAEKGFVDITVTVRDTVGGHSSMPGRHTAIGLLALAVAEVEGHPFPARIDGICGQTLQAIGPRFPFLPRMLFANLWLFGPLLKDQFSSAKPMNALIRTTTAVTLVSGGTKDNVLPPEATALINLRLLPGDTSADALKRVRGQVDSALAATAAKAAGFTWSVDFADPVKYSAPYEPSPISPTDVPAFALVAQTIRQTFPGIVVAPHLVTAATDARHYDALTPNVYRFLPLRVTSRDLERLHGIDERVSIRNYADAIRFYGQLIRNFDETVIR